MFANTSVLAAGFRGAIAWGVWRLTHTGNRRVAAGDHGLATDPSVALLQQPSGRIVASHPLTRQQPRTRVVRSGLVPAAPLPERLRRLIEPGV